MKKPSIIAGAVFLIFSIAVLIASLEMEYYSSIGPGPGFFSFWLSLLLGGLSLGWIAQELARASPNRRVQGTVSENLHEKDQMPDSVSASIHATTFFPRGDSLGRVLSIIGAMLFVGLFMDLLGFQIAMFLFLGFLLLGLGKAGKLTTLLIALVGSVGLFYAFTTWLDVQLPYASIPFLAAIGL